MGKLRTSKKLIPEPLGQLSGDMTDPNRTLCVVSPVSVKAKKNKKKILESGTSATAICSTKARKT